MALPYSKWMWKHGWEAVTLVEKTDGMKPFLIALERMLACWRAVHADCLAGRNERETYLLILLAVRWNTRQQQHLHHAMALGRVALGHEASIVAQ